MFKRIPAPVADELAAHAENQPVIAHGDVEVDKLLFGLRRRQQMLAAVLDPLDRTAEAQRDRGNGNLFRRRRHLLSKATAHLRRDDAHPRLGQAELARDHRAEEVRHLRRGPHRHLAVCALVVGEHAARFHRRRAVAIVIVAGADHACALEGPLHVAVRLRFAVDLVRAEFLEQHHRAGRGGHGHVGHGIERLILDMRAELLRRILSGVLVSGHDDGHRLADESHLATCHNGLGCLLQRWQRNHVDEGRNVAQVLAREHKDGLAESGQNRRVDRLDARMRVQRAHEHGVHHVRHRDVRHVPRGTGEESRILDPFYPRADPFPCANLQVSHGKTLL